MSKVILGYSAPQALNDSLIFSSRRLRGPIHYSIINKSCNCTRSEACVYLCSDSDSIVCESFEVSNVKVESSGFCLSLKTQMVAGVYCHHKTVEKSPKIYPLSVIWNTVNP